MTYEAVSELSKSWGLVYLVVLFLSVCAYAFWPRNSKTFDRAAQTPLDKDDV